MPNKEENKDWIERFDKRFSPEWWGGFGTTEDINKQGIDGIKSFIASEIEETRQSALLHVIREVEGMEKKLQGNWQKKRMAEQGYNTALSDIICKLKGMVEK